LFDRGDKNLKLDSILRHPVAWLMDPLVPIEDSHVDVLHEIGARLATSDGFHEVLDRVVEFASALVKCDSCLIYVLDGDELVLRASKNPHPEAVDRLKLRVGQGITGWVAKHREPVAVAEKAAQDPRFQFFHELPEDTYEAFLSVPLMCRGRVVGVINLQHCQRHVYRRREVRLISTIGFLVGAEIELSRLEEANSTLIVQLQTRKIVERAKGLLQRDLGLNEEQAYLALQRQSRQKRKTMKEIAEAIVLSDEVRGNSREEPSPATTNEFAAKGPQNVSQSASLGEKWKMSEP
jgi:signal transduction protein with GAF and PtsI domain